MEVPSIHIIIVHYNNAQDTMECLACLNEQDQSNWNVFILDNGSHQEEFLALYDHMKQANGFRFFNHSHFNEEEKGVSNRMNLIRSEENMGYGGAINVVLQKVWHNGGYCLLLNPDVLLREDALRQLVRCGDAWPQSIIGCTVMDAHRRDQIRYLGGFRIRLSSGTVRFITQASELHQLDAISGGCLFVGCDIVKELGLFPEHYFLYWEDAAWCRRAKEKGISLRVCEKAIAYDKGSTTIGEGYLSEYYYTINALRFVQSEGKRFVFSTLGSNFGRAIKRLLQFRFPNFRAILTASFHYLTNREGIQSYKTGQGQ